MSERDVAEGLHEVLKKCSTETTTVKFVRWFSKGACLRGMPKLRWVQLVPACNKVWPDVTTVTRDVPHQALLKSDAKNQQLRLHIAGRGLELPGCNKRGSPA